MFSVLISSIAILLTFILCLFLLFRFRTLDNLLLVLLLLLCAGISGIDTYIFLNPESLPLKSTVLILEGFLPLAAWLYTLSFCRTLRLKSLSSTEKISLLLLLIFAAGSFFFSPETIFFSPDFASEKVLFLTNNGFFYYLILMGLLVFVMIQLERTLSGLSQHDRWRVKYEIIGICILLGFAAIYYSQSLLYRSLDMSLNDARSFSLLLASGMVLYSRSYRSRDERVYISRVVAYRSLILLIVGAYLIGLGLLGEGMRYLTLPGQQTFLYIIVILVVAGASVLLLSEKVRRKLKVYLHKNFYQSKYDYRQHWLDFTEQIFGKKSFSDLQRSILVFFCETFACKGAALYLRDTETDEFINTDYFEFRRDWRPFTATDPLIVLLNEKEWIIDLAESLGDLTGSLSESLYEVGVSLVVPLYFDNDLEGFIVLTGQINESEILTYEDYDLMRVLARQAIATLQGIRLTEQLATTRELAAIGKVSTFVLHDLKNQVSGLSLMLDNARDYIDDPDFQQDMLETVDHTVVNMRGLIARLKNLKEKPELIVAPVELGKVIQDAVNTAGGSVEVTGESVKIDADEEEIYRVILNLLINAIEATAGNEPTIVEFGCRDRFAYVNVIDAGCGMSEEFIRTRLFKPFETTKKHGFGIGLYQCQQIIESHQGTISVISSEGEGTTFRLQLPIAPQISCSEQTVG